jgi:hypothetical protein
MQLDNVEVATAWVASEARRGFFRALPAESGPAAGGLSSPPRDPRAAAVGVELPATIAASPADARGPTRTGGDLLGTAHQPGPRRPPLSAIAWQRQFPHLPDRFMPAAALAIRRLRVAPCSPR